MTDYLTTREVAELLRLKERKVYDLASRGALPCSRATGKLLFPRRDVEAWLAANVSGAQIATMTAVRERPDVLLGSSDPLLEWAVRESACGLAMYLDGSLDGLARFERGDGVACGLHVWDGETDQWNVPAVSGSAQSAAVVLVEWAWRQRGLIVAPGAEVNFADGLGALQSRSFVPRQSGSGSQVLVEALLATAGIDMGRIALQSPARTEADAALTVLEGKADATFGLAALAAQYRLGFVPIIKERFDLLVDRRAFFEQPLQALWTFCRSSAFTMRAGELAGYNVAGLGTVRFNSA